MHHKTVNELAKLGRNGDSMLVHMAPHEVAGLQYLALSHGGSLTINPKTGLPEAFSLGGIFKSLLPMIAGGLLAATGIGAPLAALMVGGGSTILNKGDWKKGLMDGLGAFGGAGLAGSLAGAGTAATQGAAGQAAAAVGKNTAAETMRTAGTEALKQGTLSSNASLIGQGLKSAIPGTASYIPGMAGQVGSAVGMKTAMAAATPTMAELSKVPTIKPTAQADPMYYNTSYNPGTYDPAKREFVGAGYGQGTWSKQFPGMPSTSTPAAPTSYSRGNMPGSLANQMQAQEQELQPNPLYGQPGQPQYLPSAGVMAGMSAMPRMAIGGPVPTGYGPSVDAYTGAEQMHDGGNPGNSDSSPLRFAAGGLSTFPEAAEYAAGGKLLSGPGDGMSDSIPAMIKGQKPQRAALADGEFVIPADVVSHLGNGSTKAGSKQLYAMMDKVRQARTGNSKQGRKINPARFIPA